MEKKFVRVARSADVGREPTAVEVSGVRMLLARLSDGTVVAFGAVCPHQGLPLEGGSLWEDTIDCPHHHYTYDARTGANVYPANVFPAERAAKIQGIPSYPAREEAGWVWMLLTHAGPRRMDDKDSP